MIMILVCLFVDSRERHYKYHRHALVSASTPITPVSEDAFNHPCSVAGELLSSNVPYSFRAAPGNSTLLVVMFKDPMHRYRDTNNQHRLKDLI